MLRANMDVIRTVEQAVLVAGTILVAVAMLYFAGRNHRSLDRCVRRVLGQVVMLMLLAAASLAAFAFVPRVLWLSLR